MADHSKKSEGQGPTSGAASPVPPRTQSAPTAAPPVASGQHQEVAVMGRPITGAAAPLPEPRPDRPNPERGDETRPGGAYILGNRVIDSEGRDVKGLKVEDGKIVEGEKTEEG